MISRFVTTTSGQEYFGDAAQFAPRLRGWFATLSLAAVVASLALLLREPAGTSFGGRLETSALTSILGQFLAATAAAHDIPRDATVRAFVRPEGSRVRVLVRVPLIAMRDMIWPGALNSPS